MSKILSVSPYIGENVELDNCKFGQYTEIGKNSMLENTHLDDYSYCGENCMV